MSGKPVETITCSKTGRTYWLLPPGSGQRAAWLRYLRTQPDQVRLADWLEKARQPVIAESEWPPARASVQPKTEAA
jgi:hypothetical protein